MSQTISEGSWNSKTPEAADGETSRWRWQTLVPEIHQSQLRGKTIALHSHLPSRSTWRLKEAAKVVNHRTLRLAKDLYSLSTQVMIAGPRSVMPTPQAGKATVRSKDSTVNVTSPGPYVSEGSMLLKSIAGTPKSPVQCLHPITLSFQIVVSCQVDSRAHRRMFRANGSRSKMKTWPMWLKRKLSIWGSVPSASSRSRANQWLRRTTSQPNTAWCPIPTRSTLGPILAASTRLLCRLTSKIKSRVHHQST